MKNLQEILPNYFYSNGRLNLDMFEIRGELSRVNVVKIKKGYRSGDDVIIGAFDICEISRNGTSEIAIVDPNKGIIGWNIEKYLSNLLRYIAFQEEVLIDYLLKASTPLIIEDDRNSACSYLDEEGDLEISECLWKKYHLDNNSLPDNLLKGVCWKQES